MILIVHNDSMSLNIRNITVQICTEQMMSMINTISQQHRYLLDLAFGYRLNLLCLTILENRPRHAFQFGNCTIELGDQDVVSLLSTLRIHRPDFFYDM